MAERRSGLRAEGHSDGPTNHVLFGRYHRATGDDPRAQDGPMIRGVVTVYRHQRVVSVELLQIALAWGRQRLDLYADDPIEASCVRERIAALEAAIGEG